MATTFGDDQDTQPAPTDNSNWKSSLIRAMVENPSALGALGIRLGAGALSTEGMATGAGISGLGETLAEMVENKSFDPTKLNKSRIAAEAATGAIPFAKTFKEGKVLESALRGGLNSALGVTARKGADVLSGTNPDALKQWSPSDAVPILMGSGMGAAFGKMAGAAAKPVEQAIETAPGNLVKNGQVVKTAATPVSGLQVLAGKKPPTEAQANQAVGNLLNQNLKGPLSVAATNLPDVDKAIQAAGQTGADLRQSILDEVPDVEKSHQQALDLAAKEKVQAERATLLSAKQKKQEDASAAIEKLKLGVEPTVSPVKETISAETPLGKKSVTKTWKEEDEDMGSGASSTSSNTAQTLHDQLAEHLTKATVPQTTPTSEQIISAISGMAPKDQQAVIAGLRVFDQQAADALEKQIGSKVVEEAPAVTKIEANPVVEAANDATPQAPVEPSGDATPVSDKTTQITQALLSKQLADLHYTPEQIAQMAPEKAIDAVTNGITAPVVTPPTATLDAASGKTNIPNTLSGVDKAQIAASVIAKAHPKELADQLIPLSQRYNQVADDIAKIGAPKEGSPAAAQLANLQLEQRTLGMKMRVMTNEAEQSGLIAKGYGKQVSQQINDALDEANASKFGEGTKIETPATSPADQKLAELETNSGINRAQEIAQDKNLTDEEAKNLIDAANKPGGITLGSGLGGAQNVLDVIKRNPAFAAKLGLGAGGALLGAMTNPDDPVSGALEGGVMGGMVGHLATRMPAGAIPFMDSAAAKANKLDYLKQVIPNAQRAAMLASPSGLALNAIATPLGEGMMGSLENVLTGAAERYMPAKLQALLEKLPNVKPSEGVTGALDTGKNIAKSLTNPSSIKKYFNSAALKEAAERLHGSQEQGGGLAADAPDVLNKALSIPATTIAGGHYAMRNLMQDAGMTEQAAREMTNTANARYKWGKGIMNFAKNNPLLQMLQPFARTGVNVFESGIERTPLYHLFGRLPGAAMATPAQLAARYGQSGLIAGMAYELGKSTDPDKAKDLQMSKVMGHMTGQYGTIALAAFAAGQAAQSGQPDMAPALLAAADALPIPSESLMRDNLTSVGNYLEPIRHLQLGIGPAHPNAEYAPQRWLPNALVPAPFRDTALEKDRYSPNTLFE